MIFDLDYGYGFQDVSYNSLNNIAFTEDEGSEKPDWSTHLFRGLLENDQFKTQFINTMADQLNTALRTERVLESIDYHEALFLPEIQEHIDRWTKYPRPSLDDWKGYVERLRKYANSRSDYVFKHIDETFKTGEPVKLQLDVSESEKGYLQINKIDINENTKGVDNEPYPWIGKYFKNIPVEITAIPKPGYKFSGWEQYEGINAENFLEGQSGYEDDNLVNVQNSNEPAIRVILKSDTIIRAKFEVDPDYSEVVTEPASQIIPESSESDDLSEESDISETDADDDSRSNNANGFIIIIFGVSALLLVAVVIKGI